MIRKGFYFKTCLSTEPPLVRFVTKNDGYFLEGFLNLNQLYLIRCQIAYVGSYARLIYENHIAGSDTQHLHQSHRRKETARNNKLNLLVRKKYSS